MRAHDVHPAEQRAVLTWQEARAELGARGEASVRRVDRHAQAELRGVDLLPLAPLVGGAALELVDLRVALVGPWLAVAVGNSRAR